jgi:hypothetical protein
LVINYIIYINFYLALLSWLKEIDPDSKLVINSDEVIEEILTSHDLYLVRNYIKRHHLMSGLNGKEIGTLLETFPHLHSSFDTSTIVNEFILCSSKRLLCLVCKKEFMSPFEVMANLECKGEVYHPKNSIAIKTDKTFCSHEGCGKKLIKGEYSCCHKQYNSSGCVLGEGRHMIILD